MRLRRLIPAVVFLFPVICAAASKEIVELQRDVAQLQDQLRALQSAFDTKMATLSTQVQQAADAATRTSTAVAGLQGAIQEQLKQSVAPVIGVNTKIDEMTTSFQQVQNGMADITTRLGSLEQQMKDLSNQVRTINTPAAAPPPGSPATGPGTAAAIPPDGGTLYTNADRDRLAVARNHGNAADSGGFQFRNRFAGFRAGLVLQSEPAQAFAAAGHKNKAEPFNFIEIDGFEKILGYALVFEPLGAPHQDLRAIHQRAHASTCGFREILWLRERDARFTRQLDQGLGGGMVAVFFGRTGDAEQLSRGHPLHRLETAHGQASSGQGSSLVKDKGINARGQFDITDVFDQNAEAGRRGKGRHHGAGRGQNESAGAGDYENRNDTA